MASTIEQPTKFGERQSVSLPFTAPSDGILHVRVAPNDSTTGYDVFTVNGSADDGIYLTLVSGVTATRDVALKRGDIVQQSSASTNIRSTYMRFIPLVGG